jgi:uncharacterized membrane protein
MAKKDKQQAATKKQVIVETKKGKKGIALGIGIAALIIAFVGIVIFSGGDSRFKPVEAEAGIVRLPVSEINDGYAHYYTYKSSRGSINFFVLRSSDGVIRAAFDACDVCYREKKGYRQEGDYMVCNNCGQRFLSTQINVIRGGCNPAPLDRYVEGQYLVFKASDIEKGRIYF